MARTKVTARKSVGVRRVRELLPEYRELPSIADASLSDDGSYRRRPEVEYPSPKRTRTEEVDFEEETDSEEEMDPEEERDSEEDPSEEDEAEESDPEEQEAEEEEEEEPLNGEADPTRAEEGGRALGNDRERAESDQDQDVVDVHVDVETLRANENEPRVEVTPTPVRNDDDTSERIRRLEGVLEQTQDQLIRASARNRNLEERRQQDRAEYERIIQELRAQHRTALNNERGNVRTEQRRRDWMIETLVIAVEAAALSGRGRIERHVVLRLIREARDRGRNGTLP